MRSDVVVILIYKPVGKHIDEHEIRRIKVVLLDDLAVRKMHIVVDQLHQTFKTCMERDILLVEEFAESVKEIVYRKVADRLRNDRFVESDAVDHLKRHLVILFFPVALVASDISLLDEAVSSCDHRYDADVGHIDHICDRTDPDAV